MFLCVFSLLVFFRPQELGQNRELSGTPNPWYSPKSNAGTNGRRIILRYKWEAYCGTNGRCIATFPCLQGLEAGKAQRYKWGLLRRCIASTFQTSCKGWGFLNSAHRKARKNMLLLRRDVLQKSEAYPLAAPTLGKPRLPQWPTLILSIEF